MLFAPHSCLLCESEGAIICDECRPRLARPHRSACFHCNTLTDDFRTCKSCSHKTPLKRVWVASRYEAYIKELIARLKFERARAAHVPLASLMEETIIARPYDLIVPVPSATKRFRARGYNPSELLAQQLSEQWGVPMARLLARRGQTRQVGKTRKQRIEQLQDAFYVVSDKQVKTKSVLLIDDVLTTGTTLNQCAATLKIAGAKRIEAAVIAR